MLIVANHVTSFDGPLLEYALPPAVRKHIAVAMSGEMLEGFRHFRNRKPADRAGWFLSARPAFLLLAHGAVQRVSACPAARLSAQLFPRR